MNDVNPLPQVSSNVAEKIVMRALQACVSYCAASKELDSSPMYKQLLIADELAAQSLVYVSSVGDPSNTDILGTIGCVTACINIQLAWKESTTALVDLSNTGQGKKRVVGGITTTVLAITTTKVPDPPQGISPGAISGIAVGIAIVVIILIAVIITGIVIHTSRSKKPRRPCQAEAGDDSDYEGM